MFILSEDLRATCGKGSGHWGIRTPDPLLVRQTLWTNWAKCPSFLESGAKVGISLQPCKLSASFFAKRRVFPVSWPKVWRLRPFLSSQRGTEVGLHAWLSRHSCVHISSLLRAHLVTPTCASRHSCVPICYLPPCRGKWQVGARFYLGAHLSEIRRRPLQKSNKFERFFRDSTLTFLTSRNTFRLPILPTRRIILLSLPLIQIRRREIKIRGRQIFPGCASKIPDFKGKVTQKGGSRGSSHISVQI